VSKFGGRLSECNDGVFENNENGKGASTELRGKGTPSPSPSPPQTPTPARRYKDAEINSETVPKKIVPL
jgi:hypothetical protein